MKNIVSTFKKKKILLIGDAIIDMYIHGVVSGHALGASVPRIEEKSVSMTFGGNGLVAKNMLELGGTVYFVSVLGKDDDAQLYDSFVHPRLKKYFFIDPSRRTTIKRRIFGDGERVLHLNKVDNHGISKTLEKKIGNQIATLVPKTDLIVIMDPQHGLLTKGLVEKIKAAGKKYKKPIYVDAQVSHRDSNHRMYRGVDTMILNEKEAQAVYPKFNFQKPLDSLQLVRKKFSLTNVIVKLGKKGTISLFGNSFIRTPGYRVKSIDAWGAGDAFLAAFALGDRTRIADALHVANMWAALSTTIAGTTPPKLKDLSVALKK